MYARSNIPCWTSVTSLESQGVLVGAAANKLGKEMKRRRFTSKAVYYPKSQLARKRSTHAKYSEVFLTCDHTLPPNVFPPPLAKKTVQKTKRLIASFLLGRLKYTWNIISESGLKPSTCMNTTRWLQAHSRRLYTLEYISYSQLIRFGAA